MNLFRRKYRILILFLVAGAIYLCFQFFSMKVLNFSSRHEIKYKVNEGKVLGDPAFSYNEDKGMEIKEIYKDFEKDRENPRVIGVNVDEGNVEIKIIDTKQGSRKDGQNWSDKPLGIHFTQTEKYRQRSDGMFQCLYSKELLPYTAVNDDYCDCKDSTDEPGTSACPDAKFYCTFQQEDAPSTWLPSSRVNDGICDCCDGSDEPGGIQVFSGIHLTGKQKNSLSHTPCQNLCKAQQQASDQDAKIRHQGLKLKQSYIDSGKQAANKEFYGPDGVFYKLSSTCFDFSTNEYKYTFCPFKSVTQQKSTDAATNIGKDPEWKVKTGGRYVLEMRNGELHRCPGGRHRTSVVTFICGLTDKIITLAEEEKCVYKMKFSTPAAC